MTRWHCSAILGSREQFFSKLDNNNTVFYRIPIKRLSWLWNGPKLPRTSIILSYITYKTGLKIERGLHIRIYWTLWIRRIHLKSIVSYLLGLIVDRICVYIVWHMQSKTTGSHVYYDRRYHDNMYYDMMNQHQESTKTSPRGEIWIAPYNTMRSMIGARYGIWRLQNVSR